MPKVGRSHVAKVKVDHEKKHIPSACSRLRPVHGRLPEGSRLPPTNQCMDVQYDPKEQ